MTNFSQFDLDDDPKNLSDDDLVPTLVQFSEVHQENVEAYTKLKEQHEELEAEFSELEDEAEETSDELTAAKESLAEFASEDMPLEPEEMTHLSFSRLTELAVGGSVEGDVPPPSGDDEPDGEGGQFDGSNKSNAGDLSDPGEVEESTEFVRAKMGDAFGL